MRRKTILSLLLLLTLAPAGFASEAVYHGPTLDLGYDGPVLVDNSRFLYTGPDRLEFRTEIYLEQHAPELAALRPAIDTWASRLGVHPRILIEVLRNDYDGARAVATLAEIDRVIEIATGLTLVFEERRADPLAASAAVAAVSNAYGLPLRFSEDLKDRRSLPQGGSPPLLFGYFQPPWEIGDTWTGGGAHGDTGTGLQNALDFFGEFRTWGQDVSQWWVAAMQSGTARVWSSCGMAVVHPNGWVSDYYHLDDIQVADFAPVTRNDRVAHYANNQAQALCQGGSSTGPHIHMSVTYNGQRVLVDEAQLDFTAFAHHVGVGQYDSNCTRSWYDHYTAGIICPFLDQLLNNAPLADDILFFDGFESGDTSAWGP